jgi:hypothetical protein
MSSLSPPVMRFHDIGDARPRQLSFAERPPALLASHASRRMGPRFHRQAKRRRSSNGYGDDTLPVPLDSRLACFASALE